MSTALAPVDKVMLPTRGGRMQCWSATTKDGEWDLVREENEGTTWTVRHRQTRTVVDSFVPTLTDCRAYVASGQAQEDLELIQAHERGKHETERSASCPRC